MERVLGSQLRLKRPLLALGLAPVTAIFLLTTTVTVCSLLLGGGTRAGFLSDTILQLIALPLVLFALWTLFEISPSRADAARALLSVSRSSRCPFFSSCRCRRCSGHCFPGRGPAAAAYEVAGETLPWMPISVSPQSTWSSWLSLFPPLGIFLGTLLMSYRERRLLSLAILAVGVVSVFLGLLQVSQGEESALRFFEITNPTEAVGFFANRNHFAALVYCLILLAVAWTIDISSQIDPKVPRQRSDIAPILGALAGFTLLVILLAGETMARSRAGLGLTIVVLLGAIALGLFDARFLGKDAEPRTTLDDYLPPNFWRGLLQPSSSLALSS